MKKHFTATDFHFTDMKSLLGITTPAPQTADAPSEQARIDKLETENARLKSELKTLQAQSGKTGLTASQAALLMLTVCHNMGNLPNDKKKLSPVLESLWGFTEATAKRALGAKPTAEVAEKTTRLPLRASFLGVNRMPREATKPASRPPPLKHASRNTNTDSAGNSLKD